MGSQTPRSSPPARKVKRDTRASLISNAPRYLALLGVLGGALAVLRYNGHGVDSVISAIGGMDGTRPSDGPGLGYGAAKRGRGQGRGQVHDHNHDQDHGHSHGGGGDEHECSHHHPDYRNSPVRCPVQPDVWNVGPDWDPENEPGYRQLAHERLAGAVQIRTEVFDDMSSNASHPAFDVFYDFSAYLRKTYPLFHAKLELERVNTHGLLFTWKGTRPDLKPIIFMGHQDVVPVNPSTEGQWTHPPFSGHMDEDGWVWGRGTTDMKSTLLALFASAERLLEEGFQPVRPMVFSFGFDEEVGGPRGAKHLAALLLSRYGPNGAAMVFDEGFTGVDTEFSASFARVGIAEKGCLTLQLAVHTLGGHSSNPPPHTGIGIMSRLLVALEDQPAELGLVAENPLLSYLECAAEHGEMESGMRGMVRDRECWGRLTERVREDKAMRTFLGTTQAVDVVQGGIKFNALPEMVTALINYRISFFESIATTIARIEGIIRPVALALNMTLAVHLPKSASGVTLESEAESQSDAPTPQPNTIELKTFGIEIEPAPMTPVEGAAFDFMGGTIKHVFPGTVVAPSAMTAFTDTQYFWDLSPHIYRFVPASMKHILNFHTVDERIHIDAHLSVTRFMYKLMRNSATWTRD